MKYGRFRTWVLAAVFSLVVWSFPSLAVSPGQEYLDSVVYRQDTPLALAAPPVVLTIMAGSSTEGLLPVADSSFTVNVRHGQLTVRYPGPRPLRLIDQQAVTYCNYLDGDNVITFSGEDWGKQLSVDKVECLPNARRPALAAGSTSLFAAMVGVQAVNTAAALAMPEGSGDSDSPANHRPKDKANGEQAETPAYCPPGKLIKGSRSSVYFCSRSGKRHIFPSAAVYISWFGDDFSMIESMPDERLARIPFGGPVNFRPELRLGKKDSGPQVYMVEPDGALHWLSSETAARELFGDSWNSSIQLMSEDLFAGYQQGAPIL